MWYSSDSSSSGNRGCGSDCVSDGIAGRSASFARSESGVPSARPTTQAVVQAPVGTFFRCKWSYAHPIMPTAYDTVLDGLGTRYLKDDSREGGATLIAKLCESFITVPALCPPEQSTVSHNVSPGSRNGDSGRERNCDKRKESPLLLLRQTPRP